MVANPPEPLSKWIREFSILDRDFGRPTIFLYWLGANAETLTEAMLQGSSRLDVTAKVRPLVRLVGFFQGMEYVVCVEPGKEPTRLDVFIMSPRTGQALKVHKTESQLVWDEVNERDDLVRSLVIAFREAERDSQ